MGSHKYRNICCVRLSRLFCWDSREVTDKDANLSLRTFMAQLVSEHTWSSLCLHKDLFSPSGAIQLSSLIFISLCPCNLFSLTDAYQLIFLKSLLPLTYTKGQLTVSKQPASITFGCERKLEQPYETHLDTERMCKLAYSTQGQHQTHLHKG